jgi:hypothetical protein
MRRFARTRRWRSWRTNGAGPERQIARTVTWRISRSSSSDCAIPRPFNTDCNLSTPTCVDGPEAESGGPISYARGPVFTKRPKSYESGKLHLDGRRGFKCQKIKSRSIAKRPPSQKWPSRSDRRTRTRKACSHCIYARVPRNWPAKAESIVSRERRF